MSATAGSIYRWLRQAVPFIAPLIWALAWAVIFVPIQRWLAGRNGAIDNGDSGKGDGGKGDGGKGDGGKGDNDVAADPGHAPVPIGTSSTPSSPHRINYSRRKHAFGGPAALVE